MNVIEIGLTRFMERWANVAPFVYDYSINILSLADFWLKTFECKNEISLEKINIMAVYINSTDRMVRYNEMDSVLNNMESFAFDWGRQILRVNYGLKYNPLLDYVDYQYSFGFCDKKPITIDGAWYLPVLKESPKYTIREDLVNYKRLAMSNCSMKVVNENQDLDFLNELTLFNNDVVHYRLPDGDRHEFTRDELQPLNAFLVNDVSIDQTGGIITAQDIRNSYDIMVPVDLFTAADYPNIESEYIGKPIPLCYGQCNIIPAIPVNGKASGDVVFRVASAMTGFGAVQVLINESWNTVGIYGQDLERGTFSMAAASARSGGDVRKCRCVEATGEVIERMTDVIVKIDQRANGLTFDESFYDIDEWVSESQSIKSGGFYIGTQAKLYDVIKQIQDGCNKRFRYEFNRNMLRTIRVDNDEREPLYYIHAEEIKENGRLEIKTDRSTIFAIISLEYDLDYVENKATTIVNVSQQSEVAKNLRQTPTLNVKTFLRGSVDAVERAASDATQFGQVRRFSEFTLTDEKYLSLRVYDIITVELFTKNRKWMGRWNCKVISVSPKEPETKILVCLIKKIVEPGDGHIFRIDNEGNYLVDQNDDYKVVQ